MGFVGSKAFRIPARLESIPQAICQDVDVCLYQAVRVRACLCRSVCRLADLPFALLSRLLAKSVRSSRNPKRKFNCISSASGKTGETFELWISYLFKHKPHWIYSEMVAWM